MSLEKISLAIAKKFPKVEIVEERLGDETSIVIVTPSRDIAISADMTDGKFMVSYTETKNGEPLLDDELDMDEVMELLSSLLEELENRDTVDVSVESHIENDVSVKTPTNLILQKG
jgi:predicted proteasome-type protease